MRYRFKREMEHGTEYVEIFRSFLLLVRSDEHEIQQTELKAVTVY